MDITHDEDNDPSPLSIEEIDSHTMHTVFPQSPEAPTWIPTYIEYKNLFNYGEDRVHCVSFSPHGGGGIKDTSTLYHINQEYQGKTNLFRIILFSLYEKFFPYIQNRSCLLHVNALSGYVLIRIRITDGKEYEIKRTIKKKKNHKKTLIDVYTELYECVPQEAHTPLPPAHTPVAQVPHTPPEPPKRKAIICEGSKKMAATIHEILGYSYDDFCAMNLITPMSLMDVKEDMSALASYTRRKDDVLSCSYIKKNDDTTFGLSIRSAVVASLRGRTCPSLFASIPSSTQDHLCTPDDDNTTCTSQFIHHDNTTNKDIVQEVALLENINNFYKAIPVSLCEKISLCLAQSSYNDILYRKKEKYILSHTPSLFLSQTDILMGPPLAAREAGPEETISIYDGNDYICTKINYFLSHFPVNIRIVFTNGSFEQIKTTPAPQTTDPQTSTCPIIPLSSTENFLLSLAIKSSLFSFRQLINPTLPTPSILFIDNVDISYTIYEILKKIYSIIIIIPATPPSNANAHTPGKLLNIS